MTLEPREESTTIATLMRVRKDLLEVHYRPGCVLAAGPLTEVQEMRRSMMGINTYGMLSIIPEDVDFSLDAMRVDHLAKDRSLGQILAMAVVVKASLIEKLLQIYFKYFPQLHRVLVTDNEAEARAWLNRQLDEIESTGS